MTAQNEELICFCASFLGTEYLVMQKAWWWLVNLVVHTADVKRKQVHGGSVSCVIWGIFWAALQLDFMQLEHALRQSCRQWLSSKLIIAISWE